MFDDVSYKLVYIYFFRNEFTVFDTSFKKIYKANTIDTLKNFQLATGNIKEGQQQIFSNTLPSRVVNWESDVSGGILYNNSKIKADNESVSKFKNNSVIDIYNIATATYDKSFYIPHYKNEPLISFKVFKDEIVAIYKSDIVMFAKPAY